MLHLHVSAAWRMDSGLLLAAAEFHALQVKYANTCIGLMCTVSDSVIFAGKIKIVVREHAT